MFYPGQMLSAAMRCSGEAVSVPVAGGPLHVFYLSCVFGYKLVCKLFVIVCVIVRCRLQIACLH